LKGSTINECDLNDLKFHESNCEYLHVFKSIITRCNFGAEDLSHSHFLRSIIKDTDFRQANLNNVRFSDDTQIINSKFDLLMRLKLALK
jgi:uncharacterized protein YjbI with pentapeptide repeats